jgi:anti-sigma factor RsiW
LKETNQHPAAERLEAYAESRLDGTTMSAVRSHLIGCPRCEAEVDDWRSMFAALATLPRFAPAAGFVHRVMAGVEVPRPWQAKASDMLVRVLPKTTRGWAATAALLALPILAGGTVMAWLLSRSYITTHGLWVFATDRFAATASKVAGGVVTSMMETDVAAWLVTSIGGFFGTAGVRGVGVLACAGAVLTLLSVWILYRFLFRTPHRDSTYVTFSF